MPEDTAGSHSSTDGNRVTAPDNPSERISAVLPTITAEIPKSPLKQIIEAPGTWLLLECLFLLYINGHWVYNSIRFPTEVFVLQVVLTNSGILFPMMAILRYSSEDNLATWLTFYFLGSLVFWALLEFAWTITFKSKSLLGRELYSS